MIWRRFHHPHCVAAIHLSVLALFPRCSLDSASTLKLILTLISLDEGAGKGEVALLLFFFTFFQYCLFGTRRELTFYKNLIELPVWEIVLLTACAECSIIKRWTLHCRTWQFKHVLCAYLYKFARQLLTPVNSAIMTSKIDSKLR